MLYQVNNSIPHSFFITKDGKIAEHYSNTRGESDLRAGLEKALAGELSNSSTPSTCVPSLVSPKPSAILQNGRSDRSAMHFWEFDWSDCPGATAYHLFIKGPGTTFSLADDDTLKVARAGYGFTNGYVPEHRRRGWMWRVRAKVNDQWGEWSELRTFDVAPLEPEVYSGKASLPAPTQIAPAPKTVFDYFPRTTTLKWEPVQGAVSYSLEIDHFMMRWNTDHIGRSDQVVSGIKTTSYTFSFVGAQPGHWRVWAIDAEGRAGCQKRVWEFSYTK